MQAFKIFNLFYLFNTCVVFSTHGAKIQLYRLENFTGLEWEANSTPGCNNIPQHKNAKILSIRTYTCFIAYYGANCNPKQSEKYMAGDTLLSPNQLGRDGSIGSFQICNEEEGGNQLNVDMTSYYDTFSSELPFVLESHKNVCSCVNVPQNIQDLEEWSINNHHNALLAYYEQDCLESKWNPKFIPAGQNWDSRNMREHDKVDDATFAFFHIKSIGPDPNSSYYQISCNSSYVIQDSTKIVQNTTESGIDVNSAFTNTTEFHVLTNQIVELQQQVDQLTRNQNLFYAEILEQLKNFTLHCKN